MKSHWLNHALLRTASLVAPPGWRKEWLREWRSELSYVPDREATRFCLGAFRDAWWVRRNQTDAPVESFIDSPVKCLLFLAALAGASVLAAFFLAVPHWRTSKLANDVLAAILYSSLFYVIARMVGQPTARNLPAPWRSSLFLGAKILLVQPTILSAFAMLLSAGRLVSIAVPPAIVATWILASRWVILDQQLRCPVCLRLLTNPVPIGSASQSFLDWYGDESICSHGHGFMQVSETSASYSSGRQWLRLDASS